MLLEKIYGVPSNYVLLAGVNSTIAIAYSIVVSILRMYSFIFYPFRTGNDLIFECFDRRLYWFVFVGNNVYHVEQTVTSGFLRSLAYWT